MSHSVVLSALDQYMPRIYTSLFLVLETPDPVRAVVSLKAGLKRLNKRLPYLKGGVFVTEGGRLGIRWAPTDEDIELQEMPVKGLALVGMSFRQLEEEGAPLHYFPPSLCPVARITDLQSDSDAPVFAINHALLEGGIILGLSMQHNVMDGTGIVELIRFWADLTARDFIDILTAPEPEEPLHRDRLLRLATGQASDRPQQPSFDDLLACHPEFTCHSNRTTDTNRELPLLSAELGTSKVFAFDVSKLNTLKAAMQAFSLDKKSTTTNSVLCAIMWSCITRARAARHGREDFGCGAAASSKLGFAVNGRTRMSPHGVELLAEPPFLGNVNLFGLADMSVSELKRVVAAPVAGSVSCAATLAPVVEAIAGAIRRVTPKHVAEVMNLVERAPDTGDIMPSWSSFHGADVTVTSWANTGLYQCDFGKGVGRPQLMRVPEVETDGILIVLPRKKREGGDARIEVVVALHPEDIAALEKDEFWQSCLV